MALECVRYILPSASILGSCVLEAAEISFSDSFRMNSVKLFQIVRHNL